METQLSTCFLKVSVLPPMVYYLGIQPTQTGRSLKNELGSFTLLHNFLTWHSLSNVLRFMLHVLILLIDYYDTMYNSVRGICSGFIQGND